MENFCAPKRQTTLQTNPPTQEIQVNDPWVGGSNIRGAPQLALQGLQVGEQSLGREEGLHLDHGVEEVGLEGIEESSRLVAAGEAVESGYKQQAANRAVGWLIFSFYLPGGVCLLAIAVSI